MLIRLGYDIGFATPREVPIVTLLNVHPSRSADLLERDELHVEPESKIEQYLDSFGNRCCRFVAAPGEVRLTNSTLIQDTGAPDAVNADAREVPVQDLPFDALRYLINSRYCEVDRMSNIAADLFGSVAPGWNRVKAVCDWVHSKVKFGYAFADPTRTALDVFTNRRGVCRDFQHLAVTLCRALNIPARYATGYLGDIGVPPAPDPMDFSAWFEAYLDDRWWTFDARHNHPRIGRVLMAVGLDASDVAITTSFGTAALKHFTVVTQEVPEASGQPLAAAT